MVGLSVSTAVYGALTIVEALALASADIVVLTSVDDWTFVFENADYLLAGAAVTVLLTVIGILFGFLLGFPAGAVEVYGGPTAKRIVRPVGVLLRGTPLLVILTFAYFVFPLPSFSYPVDVGGIEIPIGTAFLAAILGLGLRSAAYQSQIFRGALGSVDHGQMEAARSIGMSRFQAVRHVAVPQALRRSVPGFQNELTIVLKDTSLAFAIGLGELIKHSYDLFVQQTTAVLEIILFASAIYFVLTFTTNRALDAVNDRYAIPTGEST